MSNGVTMPIFAWERTLQGWLSGRAVLPLTIANVAFGGEGVIQLWAPVVVALLAGLPSAVAVAAAMGLAIIVENWLKPTIHRGRPRDPNEDGIPSGDCMAVGIWSPVILGWGAIAPILLVAWARMARDAHYPLDVLLGSVLGLLWGVGIAVQ